MYWNLKRNGKNDNKMYYYSVDIQLPNILYKPMNSVRKFNIKDVTIT